TTLESYSALIAELLGVRDDERTRTSYYKYPSRADFESAGVCRSSASACTTSDAVFAPVPVAGHELVHEVMAKRTGTDVSLLLAEGLANALTCDPHVAPREAHWDFRDFKARPDEYDLAQAGRLVLGLAEQLPLSELTTLIGAIHQSDDPE